MQAALPILKTTMTMPRPIRPMLFAVALLGSTLGDATYIHKEPPRIGPRRLVGKDAKMGQRIGKEAKMEQRIGKEARNARAPQPLNSKKSRSGVKGSMVRRCFCQCLLKLSKKHVAKNQLWLHPQRSTSYEGPMKKKAIM